ncbi:acyl-coenzyme A:6-aminopenicillanic acid acyl-transferase-domain-containing protein [Hysterangium stoloniferum]|nr:acyl-coenzyme A:6-aminopenicillanic acid acyl-transferase-domain-containing protein [Hysterangium stoloniferum]
MVLKINLSGSSREIGLQHGQNLRAEVLRQIRFYEEMFKLKCRMDWPQVLKVAEEFRGTLHRMVPDLLEEIEGIAVGVNDPQVGPLDIIALNCRSEIALGKWTDGCTSLGVNLREGQAGGFLAQNWDWNRKMEENVALMSIERLGKPRIWMVTEAGIIGKIGFNSSAVGVCLNAIRAKPMVSSLLPIHVLLRRVLESRSVNDAIRLLTDFGGCATSAHMLIADPSKSRGAEISPLGMSIINEDEDGIVVHSNHFMLNRMVDEPSWLEDSPFRVRRIHELIYGIVKDHYENEDITLERVRNLFRDKENAPRAICREVDPQDTQDQIESIFNIVMELREGNPKGEVIFGIGTAAETRIMTMPW